MSAVVDSGPTDSWGDEPSTAYSGSEPMMAHSPTTGSSPATCAYAHDLRERGTRPR